MSVYVDRASNRYGRMIMCHMTADTLEELLAMVDKIGVDRKHLQTGKFVHFDICKSKRELAVKYGALQVDRRMMPALARGCA